MTTTVASTPSRAIHTARSGTNWVLLGAAAHIVLAWALSREARRAEDTEH